jgi:hypothetical protein
MSRRVKNPDHNARVFDTERKAEAVVRHLVKKGRHTQRELAVVRHPKWARKFAIGRFAGGWLMFGYIMDGRRKAS